MGLEVDDASVWLDRLVEATNEHDLDSLVRCFGDDYVNETPAHPSRGFTGREQVRKNWQQIFTFVPDIRAEITASAVDAGRVWSEWDMRGTRPDGTTHHMAGVIVFDVADGVAHRARFFLEPVEEASDTVDDAVRRQVVR